MVDTGMAITLLMKKWADAHGLAIKEKAAEYISGANGISIKIVGITSMTLLLAPTLELNVSNVAFFSGYFYQGLLGCDLLCGYNEVLGMATITLAGLDYQAAVSWPQKVRCTAVACLEPQEPAAAIMVSSHIPPPPPEPTSLQITSTTFKASGVHLGPQQLKELKALAMDWDVQRTKAIADENWRGLLDCTQNLYRLYSFCSG